MDKKYGILTLLYLILIFTLSSQSTLPVPDVFSYQDLLLHAAEYAVLCFLAVKSFKMKKVWFPLIFTILFGISDEIHQYFVPGRHMSILDVLADTCGALLVVFYFKKMNMIKPFTAE